MEIQRKAHGKLVAFSAVPEAETFEFGGAVYFRVKVPGDDREHAADLSTGNVTAFNPADNVLLAPGKFVEK